MVDGGCMSLTSLLDNDHELRTILDSNFDKPKIESVKERVVEPQTTDWALVGTAFDYVLRFWLEQEFSQVESRQWVAEQGVLLARTLHFDTEAENGQDYADLLNDIKKKHREYIEGGEMTDDLLASTLDLARLDTIYRSQRNPNNIGDPKQGNVRELRRLYEAIPKEEFRSKNLKRVLLNPAFGSKSHMVGGADCDLVLDELLIDIKTVKDLKLKREYWRQLIGYLVLADLAEDEWIDLPEMSQIGIYYSRHGELWSYPAAKVYEHENYDQFKAYFCDRAEEHFGSSS